MSVFVQKIKSIFQRGQHHSFVKSIAAKNVSIGAGNRLHPTASFDTSGGGRIVIGSGNEILNGCLLMAYGGCITISDNCRITHYTILFGHGNDIVIENFLLITTYFLFISPPRQCLFFFF
jgi:hypothetical protein